MPPRRWTPEERKAALLSKVVKQDDGCWVWTGCVRPGTYGTGGYGVVKGLHGVREHAHRVLWELEGRPTVGRGYHLDHLCRNRLCVNPEHMEIVTLQENVRRGNSPSARNARKTHCKHGHEFTPENTHRPARNPNHRVCRACMRSKSQERKVA